MILTLNSSWLIGMTEDLLLHQAVLTNNLEQCHTLIKNGCKINALNCTGKTPFDLALEAKNSPIMHLLIQSGANYSIQQIRDSRYFDTLLDPFFSYILIQDIILNPQHLIKLAPHSLKSEVWSQKLDKTDDLGATPLFYAAGQGHVIIVKNLITAGAQIDGKNKFKDSALDIVKRILAHNSDVTLEQQKRYQEIQKLLEPSAVSQHFPALISLAAAMSDKMNGNPSSHTPDVNAFDSIVHLAQKLSGKMKDCPSPCDSDKISSSQLLLHSSWFSWKKRVLAASLLVPMGYALYYWYAIQDKQADEITQFLAKNMTQAHTADNNTTTTYRLK
jgi:hypothetical protein